jgi:hypothetical protein
VQAADSGFSLLRMRTGEQICQSLNRARNISISQLAGGGCPNLWIIIVHQLNSQFGG